MQKTIYLASRSPRRAEILRGLGLTLNILPADIDEAVLAHEDPAVYVCRVAREKALACRQQLATQANIELPYPILSADTTVTIDGLILGKPRDTQEATQMLERMSGRCHEVHTAVVVVTASQVIEALSTTRVYMSAMDPRAVAAYVASGEPMDKAGGYGIQGYASIWITRIEGSYSGVMGLPIFETAQLLSQAGILI